ncbi:MAG: cobalamin B12-binding domain-containing protein, partial [Candidatus Competibacteraceae bacterium]|nr:cobalamin B12-binding domain-containing protein [Candidatus Competibacteraceae bacterium]
RAVFGEYRAPTGVDQILASPKSDVLVRLREQIRSTGDALGRPLRLLIGKPGLDGHSNGAEQIAVRARDVGYEVIYEGIRLTPRAIAQTALEEGVHLIGLSVLSGSHLELVAQVRQELAALGLDNVPIVVGGIIPDDDAALIQSQGIAAVYTPKDADLNRIMAGMLDVVRTANGLEPCAVAA